MADLTVRIPVGKRELCFKNPIMPAAAGLGDLIEYGKYYDLSLLGALMPNSIMLESGSVSRARKLYGAEYGYITSLGSNSLGVMEYVKKIAVHLPWRESPLILNLKAEDLEGLVRLAGTASGCREVAGIEINMNCPYSMAATDPRQYWRDYGWLREMIRGVREAAGEKLLIIKVPTTMVDVEDIAAIVKECGADGFTSFGALTGCAIDVRTREFRCGNSGSGGYCGPGLKPLALWSCSRVHKAVDIPIFSAGGVTNADDVIEHIMAGAWMVQVGSANLTRADFMPRLIESLDRRLDELGIRSLDEIRGCVKPH